MKQWKLMFMLLFILIFVSACSSGESSGDLEDVKIPDDPKELSGEITVWAWALEADYLTNTVLPAFEEEYPNVDVNIEKIGNEQIYDKLTAGLAAGGSGLPDVTQIAVNKLPTFVSQFPDGFTDLSALGFDKHVGDFPESTIEAVKNKDGKVIAFPRDLGPVAVFYRVDIFEEAGVDPTTIETWDDYIEAGKSIKEKTGVQMIGNRIGDQDDILRIMLQQQGKYYFDADGNIDVDSVEMERALEMIQKMNEAGILANTSNWDGQVAAMKNGKVATNPDAVWWSGTMLDQMPELSGKWGTFPLPVFKEGGVHAADNGGSSLTVLSASKNKAAAYVFAEFAAANKDNQLKGLETFGLFPAYKPVYEEPYFNQEQEYFNNQPVFKNFAEVVEEIPPVNFTESNLVARQIATDQLSALVLEGIDPKTSIENMKEQLVQQTNRKAN